MISTARSLNSRDSRACGTAKDVALTFDALVRASAAVSFPGRTKPRIAHSRENAAISGLQGPLDTGAMPPKSRGLGQSPSTRPVFHPQILLKSPKCKVQSEECKIPMRTLSLYTLHFALITLHSCLSPHQHASRH